MVKWFAGIAIVFSAIVSLWLTRPQTDLPPLRPLVEPTHTHTPVPETTQVPNPTHHGGESVIDVRE